MNNEQIIKKMTTREGKTYILTKRNNNEYAITTPEGFIIVVNTIRKAYNQLNKYGLCLMRF